MVVDRASETLRLGQSCILRIPSTGTHSQALAPLDIGSVCICSIGTPRESRLSHYKELLSRSDDGDGETNPVQGMVPNDDQRYIGQASVLCVLRAVKHSNHSASGPQNVRLLIDKTQVAASRSRRGASHHGAKVSSRKSFARVADTCHDVDVSTHAVVDNDL